jgi:hypothetical protein
LREAKLKMSLGHKKTKKLVPLPKANYTFNSKYISGERCEEICEIPIMLVDDVVFNTQFLEMMVL